MTFELLSKIIEDNNIPKNVHLISDSGWECDPTEMDGVYYNAEKNEIVFTQTGSMFEKYNTEPTDGITDEKALKMLESGKNSKEQGWKRLHFKTDLI